MFYIQVLFTARSLFREVEGSGRGATKAARDKGEGGVQTSVGDRVRAPGVAFATGARPRRRGCHSRRRAHPHADPAAVLPSNRSGGVARSRPETGAFARPTSERYIGIVCTIRYIYYRSIPRTNFLSLLPRVAAPVARDLRVVAVVEAPEEVDGLRLPQAPDAGEGAVVQGQDRSAAAEPA